MYIKDFMHTIYTTLHDYVYHMIYIILYNIYYLVCSDMKQN